MTSPTDPAARGSAPSDPVELRRDIEQVRGELADTIDALAYKTDVKSRAQERAQEFKAQAIQTTQQVRAQAPQTAQQLAETAQQKAQQLLQDKPAVPLVALVVLVLLIAGRRRRRRKDRS
ncbi:MAG: DUF3618 domain-containing protein [Actinomycetota bacterium]|nr:DUF3618 domain-containing protein [Actinomycetota bacterium]